MGGMANVSLRVVAALPLSSNCERADHEARAFAPDEGQASRVARPEDLPLLHACKGNSEG